MKNKFRVLLSETLPYETPLFFDNVGFYSHLVRGTVNEQFFRDFFKICSKDYSIPFNYSVKRNARKGNRALSILHPVSQLNFVDFYERYDLSLLQATSDSPFSLRYISSVAKLYYNESGNLVIDSVVSEETDDIENEEHAKGYVSYFTYRDFDRLYKFFNEMPLFRLEQKYAMMRKLDVASCFYHIYTHSVSWAITGKEVAKKSVGEKILGNEFDELMQKCNYNETNGIVVGPEVSRVFAEIIFHRIDINVFTSLKERGLICGTHYEIRRYVDDMMVFANDEKTLDIIETVIEKELAFFKLDLNKSKRTTQTRPFGTPLSCCKQDVHNLFDTFCSQRIINAMHPMDYPYKVSLAFFQDLRLIVSKYDVSYGDVNRMLLSYVSKTLRSIRDNAECDLEKTRQCICLIDMAFFLFSFDMTTSASLKLCRVIFIANEIAEQMKSPEHKQEIVEKLYKEASRVLSIYLNTDSEGNMPLEVINILLAMKSLGLEVFDESILTTLFGIKSKEGVLDFTELNYFKICSLLLLMADNKSFANLRNQLLKYVSTLFVGDWRNKTELALLFLDMQACPYLDKKTKMDIWDKSGFSRTGTQYKKVKQCSEVNRWFFDWDMKKKTLDYYLRKKEYRPAYE